MDCYFLWMVLDFGEKAKELLLGWGRISSSIVRKRPASWNIPRYRNGSLMLVHRIVWFASLALLLHIPPPSSSLLGFKSPQNRKKRIFWLNKMLPFCFELKHTSISFYGLPAYFFPSNALALLLVYCRWSYYFIRTKQVAIMAGMAPEGSQFDARQYDTRMKEL